MIASALARLSNSGTFSYSLHPKGTGLQAHARRCCGSQRLVRPYFILAGGVTSSIRLHTTYSFG
jgi:hypothetical protein